MVKDLFRSQFRRDFARRLKRLREQRKLSQAEVALRLRIGLDAYKKAEQRGALHTDLLIPLAAILHVTVMDLLIGHAAPDAPVPHPEANSTPSPIV